MDEVTYKLYEKIAPYLKDKSVMSIGSRCADGQEHLDLHNVIPNLTGVDMQAGRGVDIISNIHDLPSKQYDVIICNYTLEHVFGGDKAFRELASRCTTLICVTPFAFPIHDHPGDYNRYTPAYFTKIGSPYFKDSFVDWRGWEFNPVYVWFIGTNDLLAPGMAHIIEAIHQHCKRNFFGEGWFKGIIKQLLPAGITNLIHQRTFTRVKI